MGLTGGNGPDQGNHGEDVKELYFYQDSTPTHSYNRMRYQYPQAAYPFDSLRGTNRDGNSPGEVELQDVLRDDFPAGKYFQVDVEYAKADPEDIFARRVTNMAAQAATIHVLPQIWYRNTWSWAAGHIPLATEPQRRRWHRHRCQACHGAAARGGGGGQWRRRYAAVHREREQLAGVVAWLQHRDRRTGFLPGVLGTAQTDRNLKRAFEEALDDQPRHAAHDRQIGNQRRQLRPELRRVLVGQRREGDRVAVWTLATMAAVLSDVRGNRRQLRHLMPARISDGMPRVQAARAVAACRWCEIHNRIHAFDGHQLAMASRMARLPAGLASTFHPTTPRPLLTREAVRGGGFRGNRRILLLQCELTLEIGNALRLLLELFAEAFVLLAQAFDLLRPAITRVARWLVTPRQLLAPSRH